MPSWPWKRFSVNWRAAYWVTTSMLSRSFCFCDLLGGDLFLLHLDVVSLCQPAERFGVREVLMLHDEVDGVAALAAAEALEDALGGRDGEGGGLLVMERTQSQHVDPSSFQRNELRHHLGYLGSVEDPFYG